LRIMRRKIADEKSFIVCCNYSKRRHLILLFPARAKGCFPLGQRISKEAWTRWLQRTISGLILFTKSGNSYKWAALSSLNTPGISKFLSAYVRFDLCGSLPLWILSLFLEKFEGSGTRVLLSFCSVERTLPVSATLHTV
jgi:hypothetical protein